MCSITFGIFVAFIATLGFLAITQSVKAADGERPYRIVAAFSADFCEPCKELEAWLRKHGYPVQVTEVTEQPAVDAFPTVFYQDTLGKLHRDNGQNIYNWQTVRPEKQQPVRIIVWRTKK